MAGGSAPGDEGLPRFCPWCGTASTYRREDHVPRWQRLAQETEQEPPDVVEDVLDTDAYATGCESCRRVSHVIGHQARPAS